MLRPLLQGSGKLPSQGSAGKAAEGGKKEGAGRIHMGKAGSIACLEELEAAGKKKQMIEWSSDQYAARWATPPPPGMTPRPCSPVAIPSLLWTLDVRVGTSKNQ